MKKYMELYNKIKSDIVAGALEYRQKLPSKRTVSEQNKISIITVEHAYDLLAAEGYIESKERSGYFVSYSEHSFGDFSAPAVPIKKNVADSQNEDFPFSVYATAIRSVLNDYGEGLLLKSPNSGIPELKRAIKNYLRRNRGIETDEKQIIIGSGAEYLYGMVIDLIGKERKYGIEKPSYEKIKNVYDAKGVDCDDLPLGKNGISSDALNATDATVLHVTPYRSFPTGVTATISKKKEYINWAKERDGYIVEDDYESEFSITTKLAETIFGEDKNGRTVYINTFTKTICPSLRIGYMLIPKELCGKFEKKLGFYSCTVPVLEQYVIAKLLDDGSFERHINRIRRKRRKDIIKI